MTLAISERTVEVPWMLNLVHEISPKTLLDIGFAGAWYLQEIIEMGIECTGLDSDVDLVSGKTLPIGEDAKQKWTKISKQIKCIIEDITKYPRSNVPHPTFPLVICISMIEHIVPCGYKNDCYQNNLESDIIAINNMKKMVANGGSLILTFPCGQERFFYNDRRSIKPFNHDGFLAGNYDTVVYGPDRIANLIGNWKIINQQFWTRQGNLKSAFSQCDAHKAFSKIPDKHVPVQSVCGIRIVSR